ncbi:hypothetical protein MF451_003775 [Salmonella enterica subsp. enterica serovar Saintpaul]|nr:hypothetical protein [Salmonella enterica subsp. enterica serovar Saintpaul]
METAAQTHAVPPVTGYRPLSDADVELMNRIKLKGGELIQLFQAIAEAAVMKERQLWADAQNAQTHLNMVQQEGEESAIALAEELLKNAQAEINRFQLADPLRWAHIGRTDIQRGVMALVRAVAQPDSIC